MHRFRDLEALCRDLPDGDRTADAAVRMRQAGLTKPPGSLGRLEDLVAWLGRWQGRVPELRSVRVVVFAGNHGVVAQGVSPYPAEVTAQMVRNFSLGGAAINQIARVADASLEVVALRLDEPTADMTVAPALDEAGFLDAVARGMAAVPDDTDLLCLGEMGIGNTTAAAALCAASYGGGGARWAGRGTGLDDAGLRRKVEVIDRALDRHRSVLDDPLAAAAALGGRELAAILGAVLAARRRGVPVLLDGFVCTAAVTPLVRISADGLDHAQLAHVSAEQGHRLLAAQLGKEPILDLGMRLGEASGAALAVLILRAALACHVGMASFADAGVSGRIGDGAVA